MASPSRKGGVRCDECDGLLLEWNPELQQLGIRCKRHLRSGMKCEKFYPLNVLLGKAAEQDFGEVVLTHESIQKKNMRREEMENLQKTTEIWWGNNLIWKTEGELLPLKKGDRILLPEENLLHIKSDFINRSAYPTCYKKVKQVKNEVELFLKWDPDKKGYQNKILMRINRIIKV